MPIKFRCNYCRQFLGISRNRAGGVVDCPTCGRTIRVPDLDGSLAPVPTPGLNAEDEHLARALAELGALAHVDVSALPVAEDLEEPDDEIPQPLPEPVPMEIPIPITPSVVSLDLPAIPSLQTAPTSQAQSDLLAELAAASPHEFPVSQPTVITPQISPKGLILVAFAPVISLLLGFGLGWWFSSLWRPANGESLAAVPVAAKEQTADVRGRISYQTEDGAIEPDIGATVLLLPDNWDAASRLGPAGLRPADAEADQHFVAAAITGMDGRLGLTDAQGEYQISLPHAGAYRILVISRLSARADEVAIADMDLANLQHYLQDPEVTIGQRSYLLKSVEVRDGHATVWDHQFSQP